jgi:hypothetical protein
LPGRPPARESADDGGGSGRRLGVAERTQPPAPQLLGHQLIAATKVIGASFIGPFARARSRSAAMNAISLCDAARVSAVMSSET